MEKIWVEREIGGKTLRIETGHLAKQAAGAVLMSYGDTVVLVAVVTGKPRAGIDFFPLTADYREKVYAAGKFPGGFFKREGRPTTKEILTMRMIDRPIRPLFPESYKDEVLIQAMVLSADQQNDPDILAMIGASAALSLSQMPFEGPTGAMRIGRVDGELVVNPTVSQMEYSDMEMILAGHLDAVNMIEVSACELSEEVIAEAVALGHENIKVACEMISELVDKAGITKEWVPPPSTDDLLNNLRERCKDRFCECKKISGKQERYTAIKEIYEEVLNDLCPEGGETPEFSPNVVRGLLDQVEGEVVADMILEQGLRSDGRGPEDIREIISEVSVLPRVHGSSIFTRGETQALVVVTLGTTRDEQIVDGLIEEYSKKFMLHYNFPPICTGEVKRVGAVSRREIGHGQLAEKSLEAILPSPDDFPYTIRLVSDIMESNGSSSMASVCGGTLALMDAGVPIRRPVAGISIGMFHNDHKHVLVTDILGEEDHFGDMDFKVAGTQRGITGIQLDLKARGLAQEHILKTLELAKHARMHILKQMLCVLPKPRPEISQYAPRIFTLRINPDKIGKVIGPGGKGIKGIEAETGARVEIENDGTIQVSCLDAAGGERARDMIEAVAQEVQIGRIYEGKVSGIKDFGAFVEIVPGEDGLCHISELSNEYVRSVADVCSIGDTLRVKVIDVDMHGRVKLSAKAAIAEENSDKE
ncbi:MAG: polyribonucleotide nucleotidyltransferase [Phycisphaerae bacterium]|nr:polyribonucleotide nucleotidyltransferase [Phycisphaerae bacterium]